MAAPPPTTPNFSPPKLKATASLPDFHDFRPLNYSRTGATLSRVEQLQRQFEATSIHRPLSRAARSHLLNSPMRARAPHRLASISPERSAGVAAAAAAAIATAGSVTTVATASATSAAYASPALAASPAVAADSFDSIVNALEVRITEAMSIRARGVTLAPVMLEAASRAVGENCLLALRRLSSLDATGRHGPVMRRIAAALEPCLLSEQLDGEGRRLTHEQLVQLIMAPRCEDERERADSAEEALKTALNAKLLEKARGAKLQEALDEARPRLASLEAELTEAQAEAKAARREAERSAGEIRALLELNQVHARERGMRMAHAWHTRARAMHTR